jgi:hypothetical protein
MRLFNVALEHLGTKQLEFPNNHKCSVNIWTGIPVRIAYVATCSQPSRNRSSKRGVNGNLRHLLMATFCLVGDKL